MVSPGPRPRQVTGRVRLCFREMPLVAGSGGTSEEAAERSENNVERDPWAVPSRFPSPQGQVRGLPSLSSGAV